MSETETPAPTEPTVEETETTPTVTDPPLGPNGEKALAAEREARKAAERRLAEFEAAEKARREAEMSELEKAQAELAAEREARQAAEIASARKGIAAETGVPEALITGSDEAAMRASADALVAYREAAMATTPAAPPAGKQGIGQANSKPSQLTEAELNSMTPEQINKARREGRLDTILGKR